MISLKYERIKDQDTRENFKALESYAREALFKDGKWRMIEFVIPASVTDMKISHGLSFLPTDVIKTNGADVVFNFPKFDRDHVFASNPHPYAIEVRVLVGSF